MADSLKLLESFPIEIQERLLKELSVKKELSEIKINGEIYRAEKKVLDLIDGLFMQLDRLEKKIKKYEA